MQFRAGSTPDERLNCQAPGILVTCGTPGSRHLPLQPQAVLEADAPGVALHHCEALPASQFLDGGAIQAGLPEKRGEGAAKGMGVAGDTDRLLKSSQQGYDARYIHYPDVALRAVLAWPGLRVARGQPAKGCQGLLPAPAHDLDGVIVPIDVVGTMGPCPAAATTTNGPRPLDQGIGLLLAASPETGDVSPICPDELSLLDVNGGCGHELSRYLFHCLRLVKYRSRETGPATYVQRGVQFSQADPEVATMQAMRSGAGDLTGASDECHGVRGLLPIGRHVLSSGLRSEKMWLLPHSLRDQHLSERGVCKSSSQA